MKCNFFKVLAVILSISVNYSFLHTAIYKRSIKYLIKKDGMPTIDKFGSLYLENKGLTNLNGLFKIPDIKKVTDLILSGNKLTSLPRKIGDLKNLRHLYLEDNELTRIPKEIGKLNKLIFLHVNGNKKLTHIPIEILRIKRFVTIEFDCDCTSCNNSRANFTRSYSGKIERKIGRIINSSPRNLTRKQLKEKIDELRKLTFSYLRKNKLISIQLVHLIQAFFHERGFYT